MSAERSVLQLYLLRHADAGDPEAWTGPDADRPLSAKGEGQAERLAAFLRERRFEPDAVISSPKLRAKRTAEIVADRWSTGVRFDDRLASGFDGAVVDAILADAGSPARPMLVGHDPDFSELLASLSGAREVSMKKGALARVDVRGPVADGRGALRWLVPPDLLDRDRS